MKTFVQWMYVVAGLGALAAAAAVFVAPSLLIPANASPLVGHLFQEQAAAFVFIGCMLLWCRTHFAQRGPVHGFLTAFLAIYAAIHWRGYVDDGGGLQAALALTLVALLFLVTMARGRERTAA